MTYSIDTNGRVLKGSMIVGSVVRSSRRGLWRAATATGWWIGDRYDSRVAAFLAVCRNDESPREGSARTETVAPSA